MFDDISTTAFIFFACCLPVLVFLVVLAVGVWWFKDWPPEDF
jgi:hypothetical protein